MKEQLAYQDFTELEVWKQARNYKNEIYALVKQFPQEEKYRLTDQLIRASRSIGANIAEGHGRYTYKEQLRFCIQARGSLSETYNHILDSLDCRLITNEAFEVFYNDYKRLSKLLNGYIAYLRKAINNAENT